MSTRTAQCLTPTPYFASPVPDPAPASRPSSTPDSPSRPRRTTAQITPFPARRTLGPLPELLSTGLTDVGRLRPSNEDAFGIDDSRRLYVVADGVGGAGHGDVASRLAVDEILARPARTTTPGNTPELVTALRRAYTRLSRAAESDRGLRGMSTTVVAMAFDGPNSAVLTHLGDSRAYRLRDGVLQRLTSDHTLAAELRLAGVDPADAGGMWRSWSVNMLTRCLNTEQPPVIDATRVDVRPGDVFLLCTDGLTKMLGDDEIRDNLLGRGWRSRTWRLLARRGWGSLAHRSRRLLTRALEKGGNDNVTMVLVEVAAVGAGSAAKLGAATE